MQFGSLLYERERERGFDSFKPWKEKTKRGKREKVWALYFLWEE